MTRDANLTLLADIAALSAVIGVGLGVNALSCAHGLSCATASRHSGTGPAGTSLIAETDVSAGAAVSGIGSQYRCRCPGRACPGGVGIALHLHLYSTSMLASAPTAAKQLGTPVRSDA